MILDYNNEDKIPLELFNNIEHIDGGDVFTNEIYYGKQFVMSVEKDYIELVGHNEWVLIDFIKSIDKWIVINSICNEYTTY